MPRNRDKMPHTDAETQATYLDAKGAYTVRVLRRLNIHCISLILSMFALSFTPLPFSNSVLAKLTINAFTGMCPAVFSHILKY